MSDSPDYKLAISQLTALLKDETDPLASCANFVAFLHSQMTDINWLGIYVLRGNDLVLGPFQGLPACARISLGQGVCGTAAAEMRTLRVADVHDFPGHIACDPHSRSELVVPLITRGTLIGVLDIDSPLTNRFNAEDQHGIELLCEEFLELLQVHGEPAQEFI